MKELKGLLQAKKLIALLLTIVFCLFSLKDQVTAEQFLTASTAIIKFIIAFNL